jgi:hypothetical protein
MGIADRIEQLARQAGEKLSDAVEDVKREAASGGKIDQALDVMGDKLGDLKQAATTKLDEVKKTEGYAQMADKLADIKDAAAAKIDETLDRIDTDEAQPPATPASQAAQPPTDAPTNTTTTDTTTA